MISVMTAAVESVCGFLQGQGIEPEVQVRCGAVTQSNTPHV